MSRIKKPWAAGHDLRQAHDMNGEVEPFVSEERRPDLPTSTSGERPPSVRYLLACGDSRLLDAFDDCALEALVADPGLVPRYVWCDVCTTWRPVVELVISIATGEGDGAQHGGAAECMPVAQSDLRG